MTYQVQTVSSVGDIPSIALAFAAARGWTTTSTELTVPNGRKFEISALTNGDPYAGKHRVIIKDSLDPTNRFTSVASPQLGGTEFAPIIKNPTKIHMFGNNIPYSPTPYIAIVIEYGFNLYRHIYIGVTVKSGNYTGGEIIAGNHFPSNLYGSNSTPWYESRLLFRGHHGRNYGNSYIGSGGVNIVHVENPIPFRKFKFDGLLTDLLGNEVFGGEGDGINDTLIKKSYASFAAATVLVPVNLFCPNASEGANYNIRPIGWVEGVCMVDMKNLEVGQSILVGSQTWRVFPQFRKSSAQVASLDGGYYFADETSYNSGLAYRES